MDITSDMLTRVRNALAVKKSTLKVIHSKKNVDILSILKQEGYIERFDLLEIRTGVKEIIVHLKYKNGLPSIRDIKVCSKQSRRVYSKMSLLPFVYNGLGISIISTSKGVISDYEARQLNVGGEIICEVF